MLDYSHGQAGGHAGARGTQHNLAKHGLVARKPESVARVVRAFVQGMRLNKSGSEDNDQTKDNRGDCGHV